MLSQKLFSFVKCRILEMCKIYKINYGIQNTTYRINDTKLNKFEKKVRESQSIEKINKHVQKNFDLSTYNMS